MVPLSIHKLQDYSFETKDSQLEEDSSVNSRLLRLQNEFEKSGMRKSVEAVFIVHDHNHPHVLMFQIGNAFFKLPGENLIPGEDEIEGLRKRLSKQLSGEPGRYTIVKNGNGEEEQIPQTVINPGDWEVHECISKYYRPNYENHMYPYCPAHVSHPKELKKTFLVTLPDRKVLTVPENLKLIAVPLFELFDNSSRYGQQLASLPHVLSRFDLKFLD